MLHLVTPGASSSWRVYSGQIAVDRQKRMGLHVLRTLLARLAM